MTDIYNESQSTLMFMHSWKIEGNITDPVWYKIIKWSPTEKNPSPKPHREAIELLSDIYYWYRPTVKRLNNGNIKLIKKFHADILQRSYADIEESMGMTKREAVSAMETLERYGIAKREFRTVYVKWVKLSNVMFIRFYPEKLKQLVDDYFKKVVPYDVQTCDPSRLNETPHTFERDTYTETSTETTQESVPEEAVASPLSKIRIKEGKNKERIISYDDLFLRITNAREKWNVEEITYAWNVLAEYKGIIHDWYRFISGTIEKFRNIEKSKRASGEETSRSSQQKQKTTDNTEWNKAQKQKKCKQPFSDTDLREQASPKLVYPWATQSE